MGLTRLHDRWGKLNDLFHEAMTLPPEELDDFCRDACGDDEELRAFLYDLVESAEVGDEGLRGSIGQLADEVSSTKSLTGQRVGAYQFDELLARGGMGEVYLASRADGEFEKRVAIKMLRTRLNKDEFVRHFRAERQVLANLNHPNIPALVDAGQLDDGRPYLICEFVDGLPIDQYCERNDLTVLERLSLLARVGNVLQHAHNNLVLHLDIKPDNILVKTDGEPQLLDFGVARLVGERDWAQIGFTPAYASPEQVSGAAPTVASDVFSLGMLMYRLLTGEDPLDTPRFTAAQTVLTQQAQFAATIAESGPGRTSPASRWWRHG